jgi:hypothetical protein
VGGEVGEELVDAEAVGQGAVGGDPADPSGGVAWARWGLIAGGGDQFGAGVAEDVVPTHQGLGPVLCRDRREPVPDQACGRSARGAVSEGPVHRRRLCSAQPQTDATPPPAQARISGPALRRPQHVGRDRLAGLSGSASSVGTSASGSAGARRAGTFHRQEARGRPSARPRVTARGRRRYATPTQPRRAGRVRGLATGRSPCAG